MPFSSDKPEKGLSEAEVRRIVQAELAKSPSGYSEAGRFLESEDFGKNLRAHSLLPQKIRPTDLDGARPSDGTPLVYDSASDLVTFGPGTLVASGTYSTANATGNASVTGVGFSPKILMVHGGTAASSAGFETCHGHATESHEAVTIATVDAGPDQAGGSSLIRGFFWLVTGAGVDVKHFELVSFDDDGFTFNRVVNNATAYQMHWIAIG